MRRAPAPRDESAPRDEGMTLIEVIVAFALFAVMSTAVVSLVTTAARTTGEDTSRGVANYLATRELEIVRDAFESSIRGPETVAKNTRTNPSPLPGGTEGQPLRVDGIPYTVVRTMRPVSIGSTAATPCDEASTSELSYYEVEVEVKWPGLGERPPVRMTTIMTPRKGTYQQNNGHIGVKVIDAAGDPQADVPTTAQQTVGATQGATRSGRTATDGCVLLDQLGPGTYTVSASKPGYVDRAGRSTASLTATVLSKQLWRTVLEYDLAASITVTLEATNPAYAVPTLTGIDMTLSNSGLTPSGRRSVEGTGAIRTLDDLWPFPSGYQVWAGDCLANSPGDLAAPPVPTAPGGSATTTVPLAPVRITAPVGRTMTARQNSDAGCPSGSTVNLGVVPDGGVLRTSLPYGTWTISRSGSGGTPRTVTLAPSETPPTEAQIPGVSP